MTGTESSSFLAGLDHAERDALARLSRRHEMCAEAPADRQNGAVPISTLRELEHQLDQYVKFHDAVRASFSWRMLQALRRLLGREW